MVLYLGIRLLFPSILNFKFHISHYYSLYILYRVIGSIRGFLYRQLFISPFHSVEELNERAIEENNVILQTLPSRCWYPGVILQRQWDSLKIVIILFLSKVAHGCKPFLFRYFSVSYALIWVLKKIPISNHIRTRMIPRGKRRIPNFLYKALHNGRWMKHLHNLFLFS